MKVIRTLILLCILWHWGISSRAQGNSLLSLGLWNLSNYNGELRLGGSYGEGTTREYGVYDKMTSYREYGGIVLNTSNYLWSPNFMKINIDGAYLPQNMRNDYLVFQNYDDLYNAKRLHVNTVFLDQKPASLSAYVNLDDGYDSRENLTNIRSNSLGYGTTLSFKGKMLPFSVTYSYGSWDSRELGTDRYYSFLQKNWDARSHKSFGRKDYNELIFLRHDYTTRNDDIYRIRNVYTNLELRDRYTFDPNRNSYFLSDVNGTNQSGIDSYKQIRASEAFIYSLPHHLRFNAGYNYTNTQQPTEYLIDNDFNAVLSHQLFKSLHSDLNFEYVGINESTYKEINDKGGINFSYTKSLPTKGFISVNYSYNIGKEKKTSADELLNVLNEPYVLSDNAVVLIKAPYVLNNSVVVKDVSGTIVYQLNFDYKLVQFGAYTQILRIPGGEIPDNATVYLYYSANQPGNVQYNAISNNVGVNLQLFGQLFDVYFTSFTQTYADIVNTANSNLNYLTNNVYGLKFTYKFITVGAEYNDYNSTLTPYQIERVYLALQGKYDGSFSYALNAESRTYLKLSSDSSHRVYDNINGMIAYAFDHGIRVDAHLAYQYQNGNDIDLSYLLGKVKLAKTYRKLEVSVGAEAWTRNYLVNQKSDFESCFIQFIKKF